MPTLRQVNQRLARGDADRRAEHQREYLDRGIPQAHTRRLSTDRVEPHWGFHDAINSFQYQTHPGSPVLVKVESLRGLDGAPRLKDTVIRDLGAAVGAAKRLQQKEAAMRVRHWLWFKETMALLDLTEGELRGIVAAGEMVMTQPKRDGKRRFQLVYIEQYLTSNGTYPPEQIAYLMAKARLWAEHPELAETTETTKTA